MASTRFNSSIALALRLITKNGRAVTIRRFDSVAGADPNKPWKPGASTFTDYPAVAVMLEDRWGYVNETTLKAGEKRMLIPASGLAIVPSEDDHIIEGSNTWRIALSQPLQPNDQYILFDLVVRK